MIELIDKIALRFKSGNSVPIERAHITTSEWEAIQAALLHPQPAQGGQGQQECDEQGQRREVTDEDVQTGIDVFAKAARELIPNYVSPNSGESLTAPIIRAVLEWYESTRAPQPHGASAGSDATDVFLADVRAELVRARAKFPGDRIMTIALAEEFGELCKAVLDEPSAAVRKEAIQTAVMAARVVIDGDSSVNEWRAAKGLDALTAASRGAA